MDALKMLEQDHRKVKEILTKLDDSSEGAKKTREKLFEQLRMEIKVHETIEEEILYPTFQKQAKLKEIVLEGYEEHGVADILLGDMEELPVDDEVWSAKLSVMKENIEHHIEEEEGEMFKKARQIFDKAELEELGQRMEQRKMEAMQEFGGKHAA
jgi:hemerythrin-like domain-containing protein